MCSLSVIHHHEVLTLASNLMAKVSLSMEKDLEAIELIKKTDDSFIIQEEL